MLRCMGYGVEFTRGEEKDLVKVRRGNPKLYAQVMKAITGLAQEPRPAGAVDLGGREGWRIRVRECRVLYSIDDDVVTVEVLRVGPRGDVYKH